MAQQYASTAVQPLNPFPKPDFIATSSTKGHWGSYNVHVGSVLPVIFTIVCGLWLLYTIVAAYHWLRYGHRSFLALPLLVIHVLVSATLILLAAGAMR